MSLSIKTLDHSGTGVASDHAPVVFVDGALPGECVDVSVTVNKKHFLKAKATTIHQQHPDRIDAFCRHSTQCGGCQRDYIKPEMMLTYRHQAIEELLKKVSGINHVPWCAPITSAHNGYRRKTRLALDARNPQQRKIGYRSAGQSTVVDITECAILTPELQKCITPIRNWFGSCEQAHHLGHITLLEGIDSLLVQVKTNRDLHQTVLNSLVELGNSLSASVVLESSDRIRILTGEKPTLAVTPGNDITIEVNANDFVQVNDSVNRQMVAQAIDWLGEPNDNDRLMDLFCGTGNFSLPLTKAGYHVLGMEGVQSMVERAQQSASANALFSCEFRHSDLSDATIVKKLTTEFTGKILMDPSREGANEVCKYLLPKKHPQVVYISCNPASFARDAKLLQQNGYTLDKLCLIDMFPFTKHAELMASFNAS